jgi:hypothetical protein
MAQGGDADGGFAGATLNVFFRGRILILSLLVVLALGAAGFWLRSHPIGRVPIDWFVAIAILAGLSFLHLRHAGLAALTLAAPLLAFLALLLCADSDAFSLWLACLPGFVLASFFAARIARRAAEGMSGKNAARQASKELTPAALFALAAACAPTLPLAVAIASGVAGIYALIAVPLAASLLPFGEEYAARANRLRERRDRGLDYLVPAAQPRWGWSLSGIAIVLAALGFFGARPLGGATDPIWWGAAILAALAALCLATRDWRRALAAFLAFLPAPLLAHWIFAHAPPDATAWRHLLQALGIGFMPVVLVSAQAARFARDGEEAAVASVRALERDAAAVLFTMAAAALSLLAFGDLRDAAAAIAIFLGAPGALVFAPAFAAVLEGIFPRRATIEARYRVG